MSPTDTTLIDKDVFLTAVAAATLAPSMHNTQPWRFRLTHEGLEILADQDRLLPISDPTGWGVRIACGAAAANASLALAVAGTRVDARLRPDPSQPDLLVRLVPTGYRPATPRETALYAAIARRHSNRHPFADAPVPAEARAALRSAASEHGAWLELLVGRPPLALVAEIVRAADTALKRDPAYRDELAAWSHRDAGDVDGIPAPAAGPVPASYDLLAMRDFGGGERSGGRDYEADPLIAILGTPGDTVRDQLVAGLALQYVLLTATDAGLATSLLSQPIEVPNAREQLRRGLGRSGSPQILARIGYGQPSFATPRRPVAEVIAA